ncbi:MAG TPA: DNA mismatch repair endonuclease MutL [Candidatus Sabulitectum sp.]|nr:DNA mismatch repair endonuclease MutL [Candidatus Sabulitectum sp.]HPJ28232.1 DNA mismatch repair endonuclease MutL [Candidatus Sabulitectum sp.]
MAEVRKLPDQLINLIAAGEVVERPASVVKELLENALDAGASSVEIELEAGGRKLIAVRDDGGGMSRHDLLMAVQRHATSKIASASDLNDIHTLGFRGEALPSIASVSRMTILTSTGEEAWKMVITGGRMDTMEPAGRTRGTTVTVENLFFNQPARRKFLRSETTELSWIERMVTGASLAALGCGFRLLHGGREVFSLPAASSVEERLRHRYGLSKGQRCVSGSSGSSGVKVDLTVFPDKRWTSRAHQYILVNGRPVTAPAVYRPIREALSGPAGEPLLACSVSLEPSLVDVNAHPAKREVRFRKPYEVESAVRSALVGITASRRESTLSSSSVSFTGGGGYRSEGRPSRVSSGVFQTALDFEMPSREKTEPAAPASWEDPVEMLILSRSYIVTQTATGLLLVDQHAAHERILYEKILASLKGAASAGQQRMLLPEEISVDGDDLAVLNLYGPVIRQAGYDFKVEGDTLYLHSVPVGIRRGAEALREVMDALSGGGEASMSELESIAASSACKGAIRFGDSMTQAEAASLFHTLFTMNDPFHCPHGRPTMIEIPFKELENRFGR